MAETRLERLTEYEIRYLKTLEERLRTIYPHERAILDLIEKLKEFIKFPDISIEKAVIKMISNIKRNIHPKFEILNEDTEQKLIWDEREKKKELLDVENFALNLYKDLTGAKQKIRKGSKTHKHIKRFLTQLKIDLEKEEQGITLNNHVFSILRRMHSLREGLKIAIRHEIMNLDAAAQQVRDKKMEELEDTITRLSGLHEQIKSHLRAEKYEVYEPLMSMALKVVGGVKLIQGLRKKKIITFEDIKKDLFTMKDEIEVREYIRALTLPDIEELIEEEALEFLERYRIKIDTLVERLKKAGIIDSLTLTYTRGMMDTQLNKLLSLAQRKGTKETFSFIIFDIDNFKSVNDNFGHVEGDRVLKETALEIRRSVRESDWVCRYGGEEIGVILPKTKKRMATRVAERIRKSVQYHKFNLDSRTVTVSGGVSTFGEEIKKKAAKGTKVKKVETKKSIMETADQRLYIAKGKKPNQKGRVYNKNVVITTL